MAKAEYKNLTKDYRNMSLMSAVEHAASASESGFGNAASYFVSSNNSSRNSSVTSASALQESIVMMHHQMRFNLLECVNYNTNENEKRSTTEELGKLLLHIKQTSKRRHAGNDSKDE